MMFTPLALRVPFGDGESLTSFCSRLAFRNGCDSAQEFCLDLGLRFQDVVDGKPSAQSALAALGGTEMDLVGKSLIRKQSKTDYVVNNHSVTRSILHRGRLRVCPACLAEDLTRWPELGKAASFERTEWSLSPLRTCQRHELFLTDASSGQVKSVSYDFCRSITPALSQLGSLVATAQSCASSDFEIYLRRRLVQDQGAATNWLDRLPFYAAAKVCEVVGAVEIYGPQVTITTLSDARMWEASRVGYEITSAGVEGIRQLLSRLSERYWSDKHASGARTLFGKLYFWLNYETDDPAYDSVREIIRDHVLETIPMDPEDEIFGDPVGRRRLWSVHAAVKSTGTHRQRLRRLLTAGGYIKPDTNDLSDDRVVFPADESANLYLDQITDAMELKEVGKYLSASRVQLKLLFENGFIKPFAGGSEGRPLDYTFAKQHLDQFLDRLLKNATDLQDERLVDIPTAAKKARCLSMDIVSLVMEGKLSRVGRKVGSNGYSAVLVDPEEVHSLLFEEKRDGLSIREVAQISHWNDVAVRDLLDLGHLPSRVIRNPVTRLPQRVVAPDDLKHFQDQYISLHQLSREQGRHSAALKLDLEKAGVLPAFAKDQVSATFYLKSALPMT